MSTLRIAALVLLALLAGACPEGIPAPDPSPTVSLPGGEFVMGWAHDCSSGTKVVCDPSAYAERTVSISPFNIDRHEVTNAQYRYCEAAGGCAEPVANGLPQAAEYHSDPTYDDHPVVFVTWQMAESYCRFVGRRLPTEAEWEFAARTMREGGHHAQPLAYPWGNDPPSCERALLKPCNKDLPGAVEAIEGDRSDWGVHDLGGNVAEWVSDLFNRHGYCQEEKSLSELCGGDESCVSSKCFDGSAAKPECVLLCSDLPGKQVPFCIKETTTLKDPKTKRGGPDRSVRGGSYLDDACTASSYFRRHTSPEGAWAWIGFRCAGESS